MKCVMSAQYGKDEMKNLHFYCNYCGEELGYEEERECAATPEKHSCGALIGNDEYSVNHCFGCGKDL